MRNQSIQPRRALGYTPPSEPGTWWRKATVSLAAATIGLAGLGAAPASADQAPPASSTQTTSPSEQADEPATTTEDAAGAATGNKGPSTEKTPEEEPAAVPTPTALPSQPATGTSEKASTEERASVPKRAVHADDEDAASAEKRQPRRHRDASAPRHTHTHRSSSAQAVKTSDSSAFKPSGSRASAKGTSRSSDFQASTTSSSTATAAASNATVAASTSNLAVNGASLPVAKGTYRLSAQFGATGSWSRYHTGVDFSAATGTPVFAVVSGTVVSSSAGGWAGTHVIIEAADGSHTLYAHLSAKTVTPGTKVTAGQQIGKVGQTGRAFGSHLHFEYYEPGVRPGDVYSASNPVAFLKQLGLSL